MAFSWQENLKALGDLEVFDQNENAVKPIAITTKGIIQIAFFLVKRFLFVMVLSCAQAKIRAIGKPVKINTTINLCDHIGNPNIGKVVATT